MAAPGSWEEPLQRITAAACDPTWYYDKVVVLLRGLPGSGKNWREMRGMDDEQLLLDDFASSLRAADVVVVDERNIAQAEWQPFVDAVEEYNVGPEKEGAIYVVLFSGRGEVHAHQLNLRSPAPLDPEDLGRCYRDFVTGADSGSRAVLTFDVDPDI
ncbi:hypothetical protein PHYSODRAFT_306877 [Phytophthora sojae]|uniref:Uncharacterized protein n=1 Tax=Phytophthora sojae (strain P6497) TaxID=1094619 RepID=G5ABG3_PHYSP|nr:hypothetical protein PHYSODRAFT_306877 [Phytophthora sojae]EGZ06688.1 hypothetical protein PHYSODRAFT_306877 [Phytophthora sojae]|eukprot:XP_009537452.1 hypothetical protein PHYSODRAFT_306877 [Phytophthora sojae]